MTYCHHHHYIPHSVKNLNRALVPLFFFLLMQLTSGTSPLVPPDGTERGVAPHLRPKLAVIGTPQVVWNQTSDACRGIGKNKYGHSWEQPDSMPVAWHNPLQNKSYLISASGKTYATIGPSLSALRKHDCSHEVYSAINKSTPSSFANHQWLQAVRLFQNGTGWALIHNEFHGEMEHSTDPQYCSYDRMNNTTPKECIMWSTDLGTTADGGDSWHMVDGGPLFALPRRYTRDQVMNGYGALGSVLHHPDGFVYGHVYRHYVNGTGAGPPGTSAQGVCAWRTKTPTDPASYRGWNGTHWSTLWVDPYTHPVPSDELWKHTCATIDTGLGVTGDGAHPNPKKLAGDWVPDAWPSHVMLNWPEGTPYQVSYSFPEPTPAAPFTAWSPAELLHLEGWFDPHWWLPTGIMYPALLDHDSPFGLLVEGSGPEDEADALSYGLVGNQSLHLYLVLQRSLIVRLPVAWFEPGTPVPAAPFPPLPPNPANCSMVSVEGAAIPGVNGLYRREEPKSVMVQAMYRKDDEHQLYCYGKRKCRWTMAHMGHSPAYYHADAREDGEAGVPARGWQAAMDGGGPYPTASCRGGGGA